MTINAAQNILLVKDKFSEIDTKHNNKIEKDKYFKSKILKPSTNCSDPSSRRYFSYSIDSQFMLRVIWCQLLWNLSELDGPNSPTQSDRALLKLVGAGEPSGRSLAGKLQWHGPAQCICPAARS